jgi:hypothetical protein
MSAVVSAAARHVAAEGCIVVERGEWAVLRPRSSFSPQFAAHGAANRANSGLGGEGRSR